MTIQSRLAEIRAQELWLEHWLNYAIRGWLATDVPARYFVPRVDVEEVLA